ncbi:hypothetical protein K0P33_27665 [Pseudomonas sp. ArH3a]|uniref:hypothetical protein n=1 Tax=unclassified Pseudomonas TaxID=196821 RepID=UPI000C07B527|nr:MULTISPECIES: hypothetical protein [unclassified Pseudomonas]PHN29433.1 hypothetical protein AO240_20625 [Pseudomonas sp. ICMP 460]UNM19241.1 hypothetical protein K0P33_27665 [Pseudomonas sp. ArH3a]
MIELTDHNGYSHYFAPSAIAHVQETSTSTQYRGIHAIVRTFDGRETEVRESAQSIVSKIRQSS